MQFDKYFMEKPATKRKIYYFCNREMNVLTDISLRWRMWRLLAVIVTMTASLAVAAQPEIAGDTLFVYYRDGHIDVYPRQVLTHAQNNGKWLILNTIDDEWLVEELTDIDSIGTTAPPALLPTITQVKLKVSTNYGLMDDVTCTLGPDSITAQVNAIGKWLIPDFKTGSDQVTIYLDGTDTPAAGCRRNFAGDVAYVAAMPQCHLIAVKDSTVVSPDTTLYTLHRVPFGRRYAMHVDFGNLATLPVPRIDINTEDGRPILSKTDYLWAEIIVNGQGVYPSMTDSVRVRGRGNSSWNGDTVANAKNSYRLKFDAKKSVLGLKKGKNWVLLANKQSGSMMTNAVGMKVASVVGTAAWNHIVPVNLYINGEYRGNYNLTEKIGFSNNSIDLPDETRATLLEIDAYYNETQRFRSSPYSLPMLVHEPEFADTLSTVLTQAKVKTEFNKLARAAYDGNVESLQKLLDYDSFARYIMVNELLYNLEILFPKSLWCYRENLEDESSKWIFGPVWDWDWSFGYDAVYYRYSYVNTTSDFWNATVKSGQRFLKALRFNSGEEMERAYYNVWKDFMENGGLDDVMDYCQNYQTYVQKSFTLNYNKWRDGSTSTYRPMASNTNVWLRTRSNFLYSAINPDFEPVDEQPVEDIRTPVDETRATRADEPVDVFTLQGVCVRRQVPRSQMKSGLAPGIYITNQEKFIISR